MTDAWIKEIVMRITRLTTLLAASLILLYTAQAQTCNSSIPPSTPDSQFTDNADGTVTDNQTELIWMRCSLGQTWGGGTCSGSISTFNWQTALNAATSHSFAGNSDWRLPNVRELASIIEISCFSPAINSTIFPLTPNGWYWSATPHKGAGLGFDVFAWLVKFGNRTDIAGDLDVRIVFTHQKDDTGSHVRLVRSGL